VPVDPQAHEIAATERYVPVETGVFPLYEVERGVEYTINHEPAFTDVTEYLNLQGRFRHLEAEQVDVMRRNIDWEWRRLRAKVAMGRELLLQDRLAVK